MFTLTPHTSEVKKKSNRNIIAVDQSFNIFNCNVIYIRKNTNQVLSLDVELRSGLCGWLSLNERTVV